MEEKSNIIDFDGDDTGKTIEEIEQKLESMKSDRDAKCKAAKEQLIDMLNVTAEKYHTATGTAEALRVLRFTMEDSDKSDIIALANELAHSMGDVALGLADKAASLDYESMGLLCDGLFETYFNATDFEDPDVALAEEMMILDLCRNAGGAAEDMVDFAKFSQEEIDSVEEKLEAMREDGEE